jgi:hypothetical protein
LPFINEKISKQNHEKYGLVKLDNHFQYLDNYSQWTIDYEREIFLYYVHGGRPDTGGQYSYNYLYWNEHFIQFEMQYLQHARKENDWTASIRIIWLCLAGKHGSMPEPLPAELNTKKNTILSWIEQALLAYGTGGLFCRAENYKLIFEANV